MEKPIIVLAIGGAGCRFLAQMREMPEKRNILPIAIDTDRKSLRETGLPEENTLLAAESWRNGRGCGGNILDGQRAVAHERPAIAALLKSGSMVVIAGGLGGGTASGGIPVVLSEAAKLHLPTFCILSLPFAMEGSRRTAQAEKALHENIYSAADAVAALPNDLLFSSLDEKTPLAEAFQLADREMSRTVLALTTILTAGNLFSASFSDLAQLLQQGHSHCAIGVGVVTDSESGEDRIDRAVENLLHSPMLGGAERLLQADAVIFSVLGGPELSLKEAKTAMELAVKYTPANGEIFTGAATAEAWRGTFQITALAIKYDAREKEREILDSAAASTQRKRTKKSSSSDVEQGLFNFDDNKKGVMEGTIPVLWNGEDLDIPAYKRRDCPITGGKVMRRNQ
ncbi:MAG: hypothetical protein MJ033_07860 [Victivallaceae bacterium]|nr:hypothetical protein [Victivallaceae bacterium]